MRNSLRKLRNKKIINRGDLTMENSKSIWKRLWLFLCTKMPWISASVIGLCWLIYILPLNRRNLNNAGHFHWSLMGILVWAVLIFGSLLAISIIAYLIHRPLPKQKRALFVILRILIGAIAIVAALFIIWISIFIFAALGY